MPAREIVITPASEIEPKAPPVCEDCGASMWWHGSARGWGCPTPGGDPACRSALHRPKADPTKPWPYAARYRELG